MKNTEIENIVIIGSGNVATQLSLALHKAGKNILQVYGRKESMAKCLASKLHTDYITDLSQLVKDADLYIIAIIDDALPDISEYINLDNELIIHTSGTVSIDTFKANFKNYGVFYPLQTFSKEKNVNFEDIPICIESNSETNQWKLMKLGEEISQNVKAVNSEQRKVLHVAAVFACNFTNYFYSIAEELMLDHDLPFELLLPLIKETADKLNYHLPHEGQTGPARRNDRKIMDKHLELLSEYSEYQDIYQLISEKIKRKHHE